MSTYATDVTDAAAIAATRWRIDPARSRVAFRVKGLWGLATVEGRFSEYDGTLDLSADPAIVLTVGAASLDTGNARRDVHLRSPDFFGAERHPYVRFVSDSASLDGERLAVRGRLRARGASVPLSLEATVRRAGADLEVEAACETDHRQLGMTWNMLGAVRTPSRLTFSGRLVRDDG